MLEDLRLVDQLLRHTGSKRHVISAEEAMDASDRSVVRTYPPHVRTQHPRGKAAIVEIVCLRLFKSS
eukprot:1188902-Prorocentrum_minimum.AAC.1